MPPDRSPSRREGLGGCCWLLSGMSSKRPPAGRCWDGPSITKADKPKCFLAQGAPLCVLPRIPEPFKSDCSKHGRPIRTSNGANRSGRRLKRTLHWGCAPIRGGSGSVLRASTRRLRTGGGSTHPGYFRDREALVAWVIEPECPLGTRVIGEVGILTAEHADDSGGARPSGMKSPSGALPPPLHRW